MKEVERKLTGHFQGFVLLDSAQIDMDSILKTLEEEWGIIPEGEDNSSCCGENCGCQEHHHHEEHGQGKCCCGEEEPGEGTKVFTVGNSMAAISLMPSPIPGGEAEFYAKANYMWPEAVSVTETHKAHILVAVMPHGIPEVEAGMLYSKLVSACLKEQNAIGVYTSGTVFQPEFYIDVVNVMKGDEDELPILAWVHFGLYRTEKGNNAYTYGLSVFGRDEIEILNSQKSLEELRDFLYQITGYMIGCDVTLQSGETIGFSEDERFPIVRSAAVALEGDTLKIEF